MTGVPNLAKGRSLQMVYRCVSSLLSALNLIFPPTEGDPRSYESPEQICANDTEGPTHVQEREHPWPL